MAKKQSSNIEDILHPSLNPEVDEQKAIALAVNLAKKQLLEGTASSQVITHYLKLASSKDRLEKELLEEKIKLAAAKTELIASEARQEALYREAMEAFKKYRGEDENI